MNKIKKFIKENETLVTFVTLGTVAVATGLGMAFLAESKSPVSADMFTMDDGVTKVIAIHLRDGSTKLFEDTRAL